MRGMKNKMAEEQNDKKLDQNTVMSLLDSTYAKVIDGIPLISKPVTEMASDYLAKHSTPIAAARDMINTQVIKCTTSGALAGLGGVVTMPVAIPANIGNVLYVQMRMIACTACLAGYDVQSDQTQTIAYACLAGLAVGDLLKKTGVQVGQKVAANMIGKIPGATLSKINQKVGFRLVTKFGETGAVNLGKLVPGVGAIVGGGIDLFSTRIVGDRSIRWFFEGDFSYEEEQERKAAEKKEKRDKAVENIKDGSAAVARTANRVAKTASEGASQAVTTAALNTGKAIGTAVGTAAAVGQGLLNNLKNRGKK